MVKISRYYHKAFAGVKTDEKKVELIEHDLVTKGYFNSKIDLINHMMEQRFSSNLYIAIGFLGVFMTTLVVSYVNSNFRSFLCSLTQNHPSLIH